MKIGLAVHHHSPGYGGPFTAISEMANYLSKHDINLKLIYGEDEKIKYKLNYREIVKSVEIIHCFGIWKPFYIKLFYYAKKFKKKIIISPLGSLEPWALDQKKFKKQLAWNFYQQKIINECDYVHATSDLEKSHLLELGVKSPIKLIPHGVILENHKIKKEIGNIKKEALFFSRIHEKKGILELLNSWKEINPPNWILKIYGPVSDQNYMNLIKKSIDLLSLKEKVIIFDPVFNPVEKEKIYLNSDCFLLPSKSENFGMSVVEALSYGLPILTTEGTPWKILKDIKGGIIINFSQKNLTDSLRQLFKMNNDDLINMGQNGRNYLMERFDMNNVIKNYIKFYKEVIEI